MPASLHDEIDLDKVLDQARAFATIAKLCETEGAEFLCSPNSRFAAGVANSAFACELYLKALLLHAGKTLRGIKQKGHGLLDLFRALEDTDPGLASRIEDEVIGIIVPAEKEKAFSSILEESSNAFEYWRYVYEKTAATTSPQSIRILRLALERICRETLTFGIERGTSQDYISENLVIDKRRLQSSMNRHQQRNDPA